ncbi:putative lipoprotein [Cellulomonas flavigena DSM 20109]|uniref:Putative lipoprotein n=1 Tax=Cellulomonas flavigena (strain ATCC 482 / DSM 20109 / BCRC 11376 / JCM 18109 / NBRC 3775 / NCIMB 8073 / NRS 134) TaxID=446466 RepID=D5UJ51_CELFN|nr:hypothetical protein [Cellulomonas flavigena]ADG73574.1 putative lipoprotein [Cellulomonas flavigena DSM 20109]
MTRLRPRTTRAAVAGLAAAAALALTGCSATNPITTLDSYAASDGTAAQVGSVRALNLLVVAEAEGAAGVLTGALSNRSGDDEDVTLTVGGGEPVDVEVAAGSSVLVGVTDVPAGYATVEVPVAAVDTAPGGLTTVTIASGSSGTTEIRVPVVDGTLPEYAAVLEGVTPAPTQDASTPDTDETDESAED